jgi:hypothetical protein
VATYHNVSRTTYPIMKSYVVTGVGPLSLDAMQQPIDATSIRVGKHVNLLAMEHAVRRAYLALLEPDRRYTGADLSRPDGGTAAAKKPTGRSITFGDIPFLVDRDAPYGMIFGINTESWVRYAETDGEWAQNEGSVLKWVNGFDEYTAFYRIFENYHCTCPPGISGWKASPSTRSRCAASNRVQLERWSRRGPPSKQAARLGLAPGPPPRKDVMDQHRILDHDQVGEVRHLRPQISTEIKLTPETEVYCLHRGREPYRDQFDSHHYLIEPGYFKAPLGAAKHFQARAVVPGSRNPETRSQVSFIVIIGVCAETREGLKVLKAIDDAVECTPFTDDECREYGHAVEALDRAAMVDPIDAQVDVVRIAGNAGQAAAPSKSRVKGGGGATRVVRRNEIVGPGAEALKAKNRPGENDATRQIRRDTAAAAGAAPDPDEPDGGE